MNVLSVKRLLFRMKNDLSVKKEQIIFGKDAIVIRKYINGLEGGRTLDMTGYPMKVVEAGHVIITKDGTYRPMPLTPKMQGESGSQTEVKDENGNTVYVYGTLPAGFSYAGVLYRSTLTAEPAASIMTWGIVNEVAVPYPMESILAAFKTACPHIDFTKDEEA